MNSITLKKDAIIEAIVEIRFDANESPDLVIGMLSSNLGILKNGYQKSRLPLAEMPLELRISNSELKYAPIYEYKNPDSNFRIKFGTHVISIICVGQHNYPGGDSFLDTCANVISNLFVMFQKEISINRIGMRYINALNKADHDVAGVKDLKVSVKIANEKLEDGFSVDKFYAFDGKHFVHLKIATASLVAVDQLPVSSSVFVDIDVYTKLTTHTFSEKQVVAWLHKARECKNEAFLSLFTQTALNKLRK